MAIGEIAGLVLPVFGLIGLGYVIALSGLLSEQAGDGLAQFVITIAVPVMLFRTFATATLPDVLPWALWISYFTGILVTWISADVVIRRVFKRDANGGVIAGVSAGYSNLVLICIPLTYTAFGEAGTVPLFLIIVVHLPVMMTVSTILFARADGAPLTLAGFARKIAVNLVRNPVIIGMFSGLAWRLTGLDLGTGTVATVITQLGLAAVPCALFSMGMSLKKYGIRGNIGPGAAVTALKLVLLPLVVWLMAEFVMDLPPLWVAVAVLGAANPTGINAYLFANHFGTGHGIAANAITLSTGLAVVTIGIWLTIVGYG